MPFLQKATLVYYDTPCEVCSMRTNVVLDDKLIDEAFKYAPVSTKRELLHLVLVEFVENHRRKDVRDLRGAVKIDERYDHKALRKERAFGK